jgi:hypothetical protein
MKGKAENTVVFLSLLSLLALTLEEIKHQAVVALFFSNTA